MMVILGARSKQPISRMFSTLLFIGQGAWVIWNVEIGFAVIWC
jgi:hypothetical protein